MLKVNSGQVTQITVGAGNDPCCYARISCTYEECSHSHTEASFRKLSKLVTWNLKLWTSVSCVRRLRDFQCDCSTLAPIPSRFSSVKNGRSDSTSFRPLTTLNVFTTVWIVLSITSGNLTSHYFSYGYRTWKFISMCNSLKRHFDTRNATGWMFNTEAGRWDYGQQAHNACSFRSSCLKICWDDSDPSPSARPKDSRQALE
jgi:hypothetical protein